MGSILRQVAAIMNICHDWIINFMASLGININDKMLHFIIIGIIGMVIFAVVHMLFKFLAKHSVTAISLIYTFTVLTVIVFAIEIQQKLTGNGRMELADITYGLVGFVCMFAACSLVKKLYMVVRKIWTNRQENAQQKEDKGDRELLDD